MALSDLTRNSVLQAVAEFDELGRAAFLDRHKFGKARGYFVVHNGRRYDSQAIAGAAHAYTSDQGKALRASDFSGGEKTVARKLRELGFTVVEPGDIGCVKSLTFSPTYTELVTCLEMRRDVRALRDAKPADTNPREIKDIAR